MSRDSIIAERGLICSVALLIFIQLSAVHALAQRIAILAPDRAGRSQSIALDLAADLGASFKILDSDLSASAFRSVKLSDPFNMSTGEARSVADVIGCDYFILIRSDGLRRSSLSKLDYFEAFAFLYLVNGRTGSLVSWTLLSYEGQDQPTADAQLAASLSEAAAKLRPAIKTREPDTTNFPEPIEEVPAEGSPAAVGLKPPIPYKRVKPQYPSIAFLYDVRATVDVEADIGAGGEVLAIRVVRWAGFDLEQSVEKTVREMNWRPAMRNGKALPMRILLRYNFTKVDKDR
jgi:hypothetical protein